MEQVILCNLLIDSVLLFFLLLRWIHYRLLVISTFCNLPSTSYCLPAAAGAAATEGSAAEAAKPSAEATAEGAS